MNSDLILVCVTVIIVVGMICSAVQAVARSKYGRRSPEASEFKERV
jgi:hypothetical protein